MIHVHPLSDVRSPNIGSGTKIWQFSVVLEAAVIGPNCNICSHVFIENGVSIGRNVTIKNGVPIWDGITIEDGVFIGPNVTFCNDLYPRSKAYLKEPMKTVVQVGASIGAGSTILPGVVVGRNSIVGAGSVVTGSVPANAVVAGNPASVVRFLQEFSPALPERDVLVKSADIHDLGLGERGAGRKGGIPSLTRDLISVSEARGSLVAATGLAQIPFVPKRVFFVFNVPNRAVRGQHAHKRCEQFLVCVRGSCEVLVDFGGRREHVTLNSPSSGLYIPPMVWGTQYNYSADALLAVFASHAYESDDYVRDFDEFLRLVTNGK